MHIRLTPPPGVVSAKVNIPGPSGRTIKALVLRPSTPHANAPGVLWIHGGGYMTGMKEMVYMSRAIDLVLDFGAVVVCPGYRLSPLHPYPAAIDDCYAALLYMQDNASALGFSGDGLIVGGESAGGGLCAALSIMARDRGDVRIAFQLPLYPMLDNFDTDSSRLNHGRVWNTRLNHLGWKLYLRDNVRRAVSPYAAAARCSCFAGLPPCYTFVADGEPFYSETLDYVARLREAGVPAMCDVFHGNTHAFDMLYPSRPESVAAVAAFKKNVAEMMEYLR